MYELNDLHCSLTVSISVQSTLDTTCIMSWEWFSIRLLWTKDFLHWRRSSSEAKRLLCLKRREVTSRAVLQDKLCPPESKSGKPKDHIYSTTMAKHFLTKILDIGLKLTVAGKTKKYIVIIMPVQIFLDDSSPLVTDEKPKEKEGNVWKSEATY